MKKISLVLSIISFLLSTQIFAQRFYPTYIKRYWVNSTPYKIHTANGGFASYPIDTIANNIRVNPTKGTIDLIYYSGTDDLSRCNGYSKLNTMLVTSLNSDLSLVASNSKNQIYQNKQFVGNAKTGVSPQPNKISFPGTGAESISMDGAFFESNKTIRIFVDYTEFACQGPKHYYPIIEYNLSMSLNAPFNLTSVKDDYCDRVQLTWDSDYDKPGSVVGYKISRKEKGTTQAATVIASDHRGTTFNDITAIAGKTYEYTVQTIMNRYGTIGYGGNVKVEGRRLGLVNAPSGLNLTSASKAAGCRGNIVLNWNFSGATNPPFFKITAATDPAFTQNVRENDVNGTDRSFTDANATTGVQYYYQVQAKSGCPQNTNTFITSVSSNVETMIGNGVPAAPTLKNILSNSVNKSVTVNWSDNTDLEDSYKVVRVSGRGSTEFSVSKNDSTFTDNTALACETYTYQLKAVNDQCAVSGVLSTNSKTTYIPANVSTTFDSTNRITASDGEYGDRIELNWKTPNRQNETWIVTRINPLTQDTNQIASLPGGTKFFSDNTANANTIYKYKIQGELDCAGNLVQSNVTEDNGFRLAYGTVNGQITYSGGTAVNGVKVTAEAASGASGTSGHFDGVSSKATVAHNAMFESNEITAMAYIRPSSITNNQVIVQKHDNVNGFRLSLNNAYLVFEAGGISKQITIPNLVVNNWISVAVVASTDSIKFFVNGLKLGSFAHLSSTLNSSSNVEIGSNGVGNYFSGQIDEVRIFNRALSDLEVQRTFDVYINPSLSGLAGYYRFDEGFGNTAYDYSKTLLTTNKNHAILNNVTWSNSKPSTTQLAAGAYTDSLGSYFIPFIPYLGSGDNFTITPQFGTHRFSPATTTLLIGSGSSNYNAQDFTDNSAFDVAGTVKYKGTSCFVKDARLLIDGQVVVKNGQIATTNAQGQFIIQVPIGPHIISVEKTSHGFSSGRFPASGTHDFQQNISGIEFVDSTLVKVVGRVAGGGIQKALQPALGKGKNNIGVANVPFKAQQGNGCLTEIAITNASTGEYTVELPPLRYEISNFDIPSQRSISFINNQLLDLSTVPPVQISKDSVYKIVNGRQVLDRIDSVDYQAQRDFIYFTSPQVDVQGAEVPTQYGADTITYNNSGTEIKIPTAPLNLGYPIFEENKKYTWNISAFEIYENKDASAQGVLDSVPMSEGRIRINNNVSNANEKVYEYTITDAERFDGIQEYTFTGGQANTSVNATISDYSYTKVCEITLEPANSTAVYWKPNTTDVRDQNFRGIVFGGKALGNSFATQGPQVVTMILRDPPGTGSSTSWEQGTSVTSSYSFEHAGGLGAEIGGKVKMGTKFSVGLGYTTETDVEITSSTKYSTQLDIGVGGELIETVTNSVGLTTGASDEFVGADADLFFGRSMNMDFGLSQNLSLVESTNCNGNCGTATYSYNGVDYKIGTTVSMFVIPQGYETEFVFTQTGIENSVIPKLEALRNQLLTSHPDYVSNFPANHPLFGTSNDDEVHADSATIEPEIVNLQDSIGPSYTFYGYTSKDTTVTSLFTRVSKTITVTDGVDSVWWYNKQIRLWEQALADNEKAKLTSPQTNSSQTIVYQGGSAVTYTNSSFNSESKVRTINFNLTKKEASKIGAEIGGVGAEATVATSLSYTTNDTRGTTNSSTSTFSYTIFDPDPVDNFAVFVHSANDGFGPVFRTNGGLTSCPYQDEKRTKYYQPGQILDKATVQLEQPRLNASPVNLFNVPANGQGNITLNLINDGPKDAVYSLKVLENTNPNGAILKIDGISPSRNFAVPAQTSISKTLVVEKGPNHIAYDSIGLVFHSQCQYAYGTANYKDIADTIYVSVNFLPSCTELNVQVPQNQFVVNNSYNNTLPVLISGYDINYGGLEKIQLQYKPSNRASWVPLSTEWFKNSTVVADAVARNPNTDTLEIPKGQSYISYQLEIDQLIDQDYDLRAISTCKIPFNPDFKQESTVISGLLDRVNPHPFGSPTPVDGVLDPNDDISIQFNEPIEAGSLTPDNFQITGVLNGQTLTHDKAIAFDGSTGYLEIANGFDFASKSFTIEFWAKRAVLGTVQTIIYQGTSAGKAFSITFNSNNKISVKIGTQTYESNFTITDLANWHHFAVTYDKENLTLDIADRYSGSTQTSTNNNFFSTFESGGKTYIGKNGLSDSDFLNGSVHQLRIWNKALTAGEVSSRINEKLHGREAGLIGYWPMDEGKGVLVEDNARFRHAEMKANWEINPKSTAIDLNGMNQYVAVDTAGALAINQEMDLSIEFWFKTVGGKLQTMLSNGSGQFAAQDVNQNGWNIEMNDSNQIVVKNNSNQFIAVEQNYADNQWHHFALVINRLANTTAYIDGQQQKSTTSTNFWGFGGAKLLIGARYSVAGVIGSVDQYFSGQIDEVRIWNTALLRENIELNRFNRMKGNEFGLLAYYPFENYRLQLGVPILTPALSNESTVFSDPNKLNATAVNGSLFTTESPAIALQRPVQEVNYSWSVNNDKIVIAPNEQPANIENVTLNVSVKNVKDLHGNEMQSPKTWIAFVNKNQVLWQDAVKNLTKEFNDTLTFTSKVINSGGEVKNFNITNIPAWLTVSPSSGTIDPLSTKIIRFTVNPAINIGNYAEDLLLTTDFGFNEKLLISLKVSKQSPNFSFDPFRYQNSMSIIGQIRINGNISTNPDDKLIAYIDGEIRGVANLQYLESFDKYIAFLDVYSDTTLPDSIYFKIWNASSGELHTDIDPVLNFGSNLLIGSPFQPQMFDAINNLSKPIFLKKGWNWVSFPLFNTKMSSIDSFFEEVNFSEGNIIKTIGSNAIAMYDSAGSWGLQLSTSPIRSNISYLIKISQEDTLDYKGLAIDPDSVKIVVDSGWNRIGFVSLRNMQINTALANYNASPGDVLKSQGRFSYYTTSLGWVGSLQVLEPTKGYLLSAQDSTSFVYPRFGLLRTKMSSEAQAKVEQIVPQGYQLNIHQYEASTSVIASVDICDEILANKNVVLAVFKDKELRGVSESAMVLSDHLLPQYYITAFGEYGDQFNFQLIDTVSNESFILNEQMEFQKNGLVGSPNSPFNLSIKKSVDCNQFLDNDNELLSASIVYPNPFRDELYVTVPSELGPAVELSLIDSYGRIIHQEMAVAKEVLTWRNIGGKKELSQGVYYIRFSTDKGKHIEKVVKY